ncbi:DNA polymerase III subunit delta [Neiella marina]|uniref:DNA polymerase III subunit delta n=1 Tax=Neiella holothuriorum TaxID=2870530 RepID=A0ABS7EEE3_9GAMM|nr:DNA polymerase III subunit delta [Neiella holothuriorum]MBW8190714.1 DNA polymerase III subunit delta [Neiella holothuriorum]
MAANRIYPNQLEQALRQQLQPAYLIFGDEPLQRFESVSAIVAAAKQQGFEEVERLYLDTSDGAEQLTQALQGMSLFASRRVIVVDLGNGKIGKDASQIFNYYAEQPSPDLLLICHGSKLEKAQQNSKWFKALAAFAVTVSITVPTGERLTRWLQQRARSCGVQLPPDAVQYLQEHHEGNLMALSQELEKLALLHGSAPISVEQLHQALIDQSRFDVFQLTDTLLAGNHHELSHMLSQLRDEGAEPVVVCWALSREISQFAQLSQQPAAQAKLFKQFRIWPSRQPLVKQALAKLSLQQLQQALMLVARLERNVKGAQADPQASWPLIEQCCQLLMAPNATADWLLAADQT